MLYGRHRDFDDLENVVQGAELSGQAHRATRCAAYSSDRERSFHAMVNGAWRRLLELRVLRQVFTIGQGEAGFGPGFSSCPTRK